MLYLVGGHFGHIIIIVIKFSQNGHLSSFKIINKCHESFSYYFVYYTLNDIHI
jgi:hypothetical protein